MSATPHDQEAPDAGNAPPLRLTVLGSASPYPTADNPCSGYLVTCGGTRLWMDAGSGTLGPLQRHVRLDQVDAIWISHLHADHCADLLPAYYAALHADLRLPAPLPLFGPPGIADRLAGFLTNSASRSPVESAFAVTELYDGHRTALGPLTLTSRAVSHGIPAFALRVESPTGTLVYSGDSAPCASLTELAADCDTLLCEADLPHHAPSGPPVHHTPEDAAATARDARASRLLLTHIGRSLTPPQALTRAAAHHSLPVTHATPGTTFTVGLDP